MIYTRESNMGLKSAIFVKKWRERINCLELVELRATALTLRFHKIWRQIIFWLVKEELAQNSTHKTHTQFLCK